MANGAGTTTAPVSAEIRQDAEGRRRLIATVRIAAGAEILPLVGTVRSSPTRFSIQVGPNEHLDDMGPIDATNHACDPTAFVDFSDGDRPVLRALQDLSPGGEVTIHYGATEYDMQSPFTCDCGSDACVGLVRGYRHLSEETARKLEPSLSPALRRLLSGPVVETVDLQAYGIITKHAEAANHEPYPHK